MLVRNMVAFVKMLIMSSEPRMLIIYLNQEAGL